MTTVEQLKEWFKKGNTPKRNISGSGWILFGIKTKKFLFPVLMNLRIISMQSMIKQMGKYWKREWIWQKPT